MIVLGASVLIAHLDATDVHHRRATQLLLLAGSEELVASPLTLAEVLVGPARLAQLERAELALRALSVATVSLPMDAPARLARLAATTGLRLPDCCVLLATETSSAAVATFDDRLERAANDLNIAVTT